MAILEYTKIIILKKAIYFPLGFYSLNKDGFIMFFSSGNWAIRDIYERAVLLK